MGRWGFFITFEGVEGSGKTTLAQGLYRFLEEENFKVVFTREPGGTPGAEAIREVVLSRKVELDPWAELFLMLAARRENVVRVVYPHLRDGYVVLCDRFSDSTMAYQGFGRGLPQKIISRFNKFATMNLKPNLTFLVDIPPEKSFERIKGREQDRFEREEFEFHVRVREGYLKLARRARRRIHVLDGMKAPEVLLEEVKSITLERLKERGLGRFLKKENSVVR